MIVLKREYGSGLFGLGGWEVLKSNIHAKKAVIDRHSKPLIAVYLKAMNHRRF